MKYYFTEDINEDSLERDLNQLLSVSKAASMLGINTTTLRRWENEGHIQCYRVGTAKHRRFKKRDILLFLEASRSNS